MLRFIGPALVLLACLAPVSSRATPSPPCGNTARPGGAGTSCYAPSQFARYAGGLPFAGFDPSAVVGKTAQLPAVRVLVHRIDYPPTGVNAYPIGPPLSIDMEFGKLSIPQDPLGPVQRVATYVSVIEYQLSQDGKPRVRRVRPNAQWIFTADVPRQSMSIEVQSDGPKAVVGAIGYAVFRAESRLPTKPIATARVYVTVPHILHAGRPATFWVLVAPRWGTRPAGGFDADFSLSGAWNRPRTVTPDGSQACGGDNIAGQPSLRRGRWVFHWGDCRELGLILTPHGTGAHGLTLTSYNVPITARGQLDFAHEKPAPGSGYRWRGMVRK